MISDSETQFILEGISQNQRNDSRTRDAYRTIMLETGVLPFTAGSSRVKVGTPATDILVGIKVDVSDDTDITTTNPIQCTLDCSPKFMDTRTIQQVSTFISSIFTRTALPMLGWDKLTIIEGQCTYVLYIDVMILALSGGSVENVIFLAIKAALMTTKIPQHSIVSLDDCLEYVLDLDPANAFILPGVQDLPLCVTVNKMGSHYIIDATCEEELVASTRLHVLTSSGGTVVHVHKSGPGGIEPSLLKEMILSSRKLASTLHAQLESAITREQALPTSKDMSKLLKGRHGF